MVFIHSDVYQPFKCQTHKMVKHTQTIHRQQPTNCLSMCDHFVELAVKGLKMLIAQERSSCKFLKNNLECLSFWSTYIFYTFAFNFFLKKDGSNKKMKKKCLGKLLLMLANWLCFRRFQFLTIFAELLSSPVAFFGPSSIIFFYCWVVTYGILLLIIM